MWLAIKTTLVSTIYHGDFDLSILIMEYAPAKRLFQAIYAEGRLNTTDRNFQVISNHNVEDGIQQIPIVLEPDRREEFSPSSQKRESREKVPCSDDGSSSNVVFIHDKTKWRGINDGMLDSSPQCQSFYLSRL